MPLPHAKKSASKKRKKKVMGEVMRKLSEEHPEMEQDQKVAIGLKQSGQSNKPRRRRRKK